MVMRKFYDLRGDMSTMEDRQLFMDSRVDKLEQECVKMQKRDEDRQEVFFFFPTPPTKTTFFFMFAIL